VKIQASTLDDLLHQVFDRLLRKGRVVQPSKGKALEASGVLIELTNPRARMSRSEARHLLFGCLGEFLWYLSGDDTLSFIRYYITDYPADGDDVATLRAAYGPRIRSPRKDQLRWIVKMLREKPDTRRAVIPIYWEKDTHIGHPEVPCTCTLQFLLRNQRIELLTHMRSNDAFKGLPGDVFAFTMIQELIARSLNVEIGSYKHFVGSLHLYECNFEQAKRFLAEGWQPRHTMPVMPIGDQFRNLSKVLEVEAALRAGKKPEIPTSLPHYWKDIVQLLRIYKADRDKAPSKQIAAIRSEIYSTAYAPYIESKQRKARKREQELQHPPAATLFPL
jgi:thymidylate synthase